MYNGDRFTGEFKKMAFGILTLSTLDVGTIEIEWNAIEGVHSTKYFEVTLIDNSRYYGKIDSALQVHVSLLMQDLDLQNFLDAIIDVVPIKKRFLDKIDLVVSLGYQFNKGSRVSTFNSGLDFRYRQEKDEINISFKSYITDRLDEGESFKKQDANFSYNHFYKQSWALGAFSAAEQNSELGLDLRLSLGSEVTKKIVQTGHAEFKISAGAQGTREFSDEGVEINNAEGKIQGAYRFFRYDTPKLSVTSNVVYFPSITTSGRYRFEANLNARWEIINDLYFDVTFYNNFDSDPVSTTAANNDWGITTGISYTIF